MGRFEAGYAEGNVEPLLQNAPDFEDEAESADYISPVNPLFPTLSRPNRILSKHGKHPNVRSSGVPGGWGLYRRDWFHTICYMRWSSLVTNYCIVYASFWLLFSVLYIPMTLSEQCREETNVETWQDAMFLSVMVSSTIGFGYERISFACSWYPFVVLMIQVLVDMALQSMVIGVLVVKMSRPQGRRRSILFSPAAVINTATGGHPELQIRFAEARKQQLIETHIRLILYEYNDTGDGHFDFTTTPLLLEYCVEVEVYVFLATPWVSRHIITPSSPLHKYFEGDCEGEFEIVAVVEGIESVTGLNVQRTESYTSTEVLHGHQFAPCCRKSRSGHIEVDFSRLGATEPCPCTNRV